MRREGFTLVEVLIALGLFALIAAAGTAVLTMSVQNRSAIKGATDRLGALQRTRALLRADLGQATLRRTRDRNGEPGISALAGATGPGSPILMVTRAGWSNAGRTARASLQRVEYQVTDGRLERRVSAHLDGARPGAPQVLMEDVSDVTLSFLRDGQETAAPTSDLARPLPDAVRLTMMVEGYGPVTQLFLVGGGR